ncbi:MAG: cytochrome c5 family protein [Caulobacterales bacterium]|nr:cytochrome c5 family protein [Caulobacterales bacterium]
MGLHELGASFDTAAARPAQDDASSGRHGEQRRRRVSNHATCIGATFLALTLTACGAASKPAPTPEQAALLRPSDPRLSELYETSCKACHTITESGAPMVHDQAAWAPRWKQGLPVLVDHSIQGFNAMPAGGQCATCTPADLEALIRFMADHEESAD